MLPRFFIGTMHCGEGDFNKCCESINTQIGVTAIHHVVSNLPEREAHNELWAAWRSQKHEFDAFVKVDADTELIHDEVLSEFWKMMTSNPRITGIQAPLHDYFTNDFINGLNCFSPRVTFRDTSDDLFCDRRVDTDHDVVIKAENVSPLLKPAGLHCHNATRLQSFHFGVHRMLKGQADIIARVSAVWAKEHSHNLDDNRSLVLLGAASAPSFAQNRKFNYSDEELSNACNEAFTKRRELLT